MARISFEIRLNNDTETEVDVAFNEITKSELGKVIDKFFDNIPEDIMASVLACLISIGDQLKERNKKKEEKKEDPQDAYKEVIGKFKKGNCSSDPGNFDELLANLFDGTYKDHKATDDTESDDDDKEETDDDEESHISESKNAVKLGEALKQGFSEGAKTDLYESDDKMVSHPPHYQGKGKFEVIDVIEQITEPYSGILATDIGNIVKYALRWPNKGGYQDLEKIIWYAFHIKQLENPETLINGNSIEKRITSDPIELDDIIDNFKDVYPDDETANSMARIILILMELYVDGLYDHVLISPRMSSIIGFVEKTINHLREIGWEKK